MTLYSWVGGKGGLSLKDFWVLTSQKKNWESQAKKGWAAPLLFSLCQETILQS